METPAVSHVEVNGNPCRVWTKGKGQRIGFLAGFGGLPKWIAFLDQLAERFEVVYEVYSIRKRHRIRIKTRVPEHDCRVDSMTDIWMGADFMEREVFDMMGIRFNHHPDLRRILMPDDYTEGYPLRKDFPVQGKGWRDTFDFLNDPT